MKLAILFWFYKEVEICKNRLELIRYHNPTVPIYGLYGGPLETADFYKSALREYLNDFYAFSQNKSSLWKWLQGDRLIATWYSERGKTLAWDTIVIVQWDMLVLDSVHKIFSMLEPEQILLSGLVPISQEIEDNWSWTGSHKPECRKTYLEFLEHIKNRYNYEQESLCCGFIVVCFPRDFLQKFSEIEQPELGFLEYKVPIYAQIFGTPICTDHPFQLSWSNPDTAAKNRKILNAENRDISLATIAQNLVKINGARIFHPYRKIFPFQKKQWLLVLPILLQEQMDYFVGMAKRLRNQNKN